MQDTETFIPHENDVKTPSKGGTIFLVISLILFLVSIGIAGAAYFVRVSAAKKIYSYTETLNKSKERFNTGIPVRTIEQFDIRLASAENLLSRHKSFENLFELIERLTLKNVQFTSFSYNEVDNTKRNVVKLVGRASDYKTIAEESEQFSLDEEAKRYITDVVFSNLNLDSKTSNLIQFEIEFTVDPEFLLYSKSLGSDGVIESNPGSGSLRGDVPNIRNQ